MLTNGQEIDVDGAGVKCLYTPGHSTDHIVLVEKEDGALFSGDCILGIFQDIYTNSVRILHSFLHLICSVIEL